MNLNVATVLELIWEYMGLLRIYTKKRAEPPSFEEPVVLSKYRNGLTVEGAVSQISLELLEKFCHEHGVFSAGDAGGNLVAGLDQPVLLYGSHKGVPERFPEFLLNAPLDHLIGFQFFFHFVSSR